MQSRRRRHRPQGAARMSGEIRAGRRRARWISIAVADFRETERMDLF